MAPEGISDVDQVRKDEQRLAELQARMAAEFLYGYNPQDPLGYLLGDPLMPSGSGGQVQTTSTPTPRRG